MSKTDPNLRGRLLSAPTYQKALAGQWWAPGMPQTPGFRAENLRAAARVDGIEIPSGYAFDQGSGSFTDANADHWYSDPRVLGPLAVGAAGGLGAAFGGPSGLGGILPSSQIPNSLAMQAVPGASSTLGGGVAGAMSGGAGAAASGVGKSLLDRLLSPEGIATAGTIAASLAAGGNGSNDATRATEEQARRMQAITEARMRRVDPLHEAVTQLAFSRLPVNSRNGIALPRVALPREG